MKVNAEELKNTQVEQSIFKPMINPNDANDSFLTFCVPTEETLLKRKFDEDQIGEKYEYECAKEYRSEKGDQDSRNFFFVLREEQGVFYNECQLKLMLQVRTKVLIFFLFHFSFFIDWKKKNHPETKTRRFCSTFWHNS